MPAFQAINWCFTLNNPKNNEVPEEWKDHVDYCIWQREKGAEGTEHLQGYLHLKAKKSLSTMKMMNGQCHWEARQGTHDQAKDYCTKLETRLPGTGTGPWTYGTEPRQGQGKRNDLQSVKDAIDAGSTLAQIADSHFTVFVKYSRGLKEYMILKGMNERSWMTHTTVYWGPTGTGKSSRALCEARRKGRVYYLTQPANGQQVFFDGYDGQETVVIEEFYGWIQWTMLLKLCDRLPMLVHTKGGMVSFFPKWIIITSNVNPARWYKNIADPAALHRRINDPSGATVYMGTPMPDGWKDTEPRIVSITEAGEKRLPNPTDDDADDDASYEEQPGNQEEVYTHDEFGSPLSEEMK